MSRTVLLSEVDEVARRYPGCVPEIRGVLDGAGLPENPEHALTAVADRMAGDAAFRERLHACVRAMCAREPQISHLEVVGLLVVAVAGAEGAAALHDHPAVRTLFSFVLAWRRRSREVSVADAPKPSVETRRTAAERDGMGTRRVRPGREPMDSRSPMLSQLGSVEEEAERTPRRWGMWTAVTCGCWLALVLAPLLILITGLCRWPRIL